MAHLKAFSLLLCLAALAFAAPSAPIATAAPVVPAVTETPKVAQPAVPETTVAPAVPAAVTVAAETTVAPTTAKANEAATTVAVVAAKEVKTAEGAATTIVAAATEAKTAGEKVRLCSCDEVKDCNAESKAKVEDCKKECVSYLDVFGNDTEGYKSCFKDIHDETVRVTDCFKLNAEGFCEKNAKANATFIDKPDYTSYTAVAEVNETTTDTEFKFDFAKKARKFYVNIRKYQNCAVSCVKKEAVKCYEKKGCAVSIPDATAQKALYSGTCAMVEPMMRTHTSLTCTCLAFQKKVKDMQTSCGLTASPYFMRNF